MIIMSVIMLIAGIEGIIAVVYIFFGGAIYWMFNINDAFSPKKRIVFSILWLPFLFYIGIKGAKHWF